MLFQRSVLEDLFNEIRNTHKTEPWQALLACINPDSLDRRLIHTLSCISEYEIYFNFVFSRNYHVKISKLVWEDCRFSFDRIKRRQMDGFHYVSCHEYMS